MIAATRDSASGLLIAARLVTFAIICGVLYLGKVVLIPIALAAFITFLLGPLVTKLDRAGVPRALGVVLVTIFVMSALGGLSYIVAGELATLANELPAYRKNVRAKIADLRNFTRGGTLESVQATFDDFSRDVEDAAATVEEARTPGTPQASQPVRVEVVPEPLLFGETALLTQALKALGTAGLTALLAIFMLIRREDLRNRIVSLAGQTSLAITTKAFADAGKRISRYLLMQFIVNMSMGAAVGIGLAVIGVPYAALWGLCTAIFRYVPFAGYWIAASLPLAMSLIIAPGWEQVALVLALYAIVNLVTANVVEPWLYGQSVGLSALAVILATIFWAWIWGPVGLVLATPLTVCLVVLSTYIPGLAIFDRLLNQRAALESHLWLYQRLLSRDEDEAEQIVEQHLAQHSLAETCDQLLIGTLVALKQDLARGRITSAEGDFVAGTLREIISSLPPSSSTADRASPMRADKPLLLIGLPVHDDLDEIALQLLGLLLADEHCELQILSPETLIGERIAAVEELKPAAVCIASLPPGELTATRHACKRLRSKLPELRLIVARLGAPKASTRSAELLRAAGAQTTVATLAELRDVVQRLVRDARPGDASALAAVEPPVATVAALVR